MGKNRSFVLCLLFIALSLAVLGCTTPSPTPLAPHREPSPSPERVTPAHPPSTPSPSEHPIPSTIVLTMWTTEEFSPSSTSAGEILAGQLSAFSSEHPDIEVKCILKKPYGRGGILDFLLTTREAAPRLLPDLVVLDAFELGEAARAGLLQPLENILSSELQDDLFPFAREAGTLGRHLLGVQFQADVEHLVYIAREAEKPPSTWTEVLEGGRSYVFPAAGQDVILINLETALTGLGRDFETSHQVNDALLIAYLAAGGSLLDEEGKPALDPAVLTQVFQFYADGVAAGVIPSSVAEVHSLDEAWSLFVAGKADLAHISSAHYLAGRDQIAGLAFAPLPTKDGTIATMSRGWVLAIVTEDPVRRAAAAQLIEWLMKPENNAAWNLAAGHLPTRRSALEKWRPGDEYTSFIRGQLDVAFFRPSTPAYHKIAEALQEALRDVLSGRASPEEAAQWAVYLASQGGEK